MITARFRFDFALSFSGEVRDIARDVRTRLRNEGFSVYFDEDYEEEMLGRDGSLYLRRIYSKESRYCVVLISKGYDASAWTGLERESIQAREINGESGVLIPVLVDGYRPEWLPATRIYFEMAKRAVPDLVTLLGRLDGVSAIAKSKRQLLAQRVLQQHRKLCLWWSSEFIPNALNLEHYRSSVVTPAIFKEYDELFVENRPLMSEQVLGAYTRYRAAVEQLAILYRKLSMYMQNEQGQTIRDLCLYGEESRRHLVIDFDGLRVAFLALMDSLESDFDRRDPWVQETPWVMQHDFRVIKEACYGLSAEPCAAPDPAGM